MNKLENKTVIIVAQRISTIMDADQIIVLEEGKIVGKGTHEELLKNCETYRQIALSQLSAEELNLEEEKKEEKNKQNEDSLNIKNKEQDSKNQNGKVGE